VALFVDSKKSLTLGILWRALFAILIFKIGIDGCDRR